MKNRQLQQIDTAAIAWAAGGRWLDILERVGGIPRQHLDHKHHPCPKCGGRDRFRLIDERDGAVLCNQCGRSNGDGIASVRWAADLTFPEACKRICEFLGIEVPTIGHQIAPQGHQRAQKPAVDQLAFRPWNENLVRLWCRHKPPITPEAVQTVGGKLARYLGQFTVVALPVLGERLMDAEPVGWVLYNTTGKGLPVFERGGHEPTSWAKVKTLPGTGRGWIGNVQCLARANVVWKLEGPSDVMGLLSVADRPADVAVMTNVHGCGENPAGAPWMLESLRGKVVNVCHDADKPGQDGAATRDNRPGWAPAIATTAAETRNVVLPYPIKDNHGKDIRDWLNEGHGYQDLIDLAAAAPTVKPAANVSMRPIESADDPDRLARMNLDRYATAQGGRTLRYWRGEWYVWRVTHYRKIEVDELHAKIWRAVKEEFDRQNLLDQESGDGGDDGPKAARKVTTTLVNNVIRATASLPGVLIPSHIERMTWMPDRSRRRYVSMENGLIDLDAVLDDRPENECILPHSPNWFSTVSLPYGFDKAARCPLWDAFLQRNLDGDQEVIDLLQEWAGYLLTPDTGQQKFLMLEGEGGNGKGVYTAGLVGMLGMQNCSFVPLEAFADRFSKTQTLGRLLNVAADSGELDKVAEGFLKSFTSGDPMSFDRKGISAIEARPTARLMICCNQRPRFSDRSDGVWRRMIPVYMSVQINDGERVIGMDKSEWWQQQGELPGIFLWALRGLARLHTQGRFTEPAAVKENLDDYKSDMNPAKVFLEEYVDESPPDVIRSSVLYSFYKRWVGESGHRPLSDRQFFKEVKRKFKRVTKKRNGPRNERYWCYEGIKFSQDEILGEKTSEQLF